MGELIEGVAQGGVGHGGEGSEMVSECLENVPEEWAFCQMGQGFAQLARGSAGG